MTVESLYARPQEEKPKTVRPRLCWRVDRWCNDYCVAYEDGVCGVLELLKSLHDSISSLEAAITDLTEALMRNVRQV
jgi:hypothetical protein